jgi:hypothetical protein
LRIKMKGPLDLTHARGLAAAMRDIEAREVKWASVTVRVNTGGGGTKPVTIDNPLAVAREADAKFKEALERSVRDAIERKTNPSWAKRAAGYVGHAAVEVASSLASATGRWIASKAPASVRESASATGAAAKESVIAAGELAALGVQAAGKVAANFETGRELQRRIDNAQLVATRVIVEVVDRDGVWCTYAPWVIDPFATLRNEKTAAYLNGGMTALGWGPVAPVAQAALAAGFSAWGALSVDDAEGRARTNMGIEQFLQAVASAIPGASFYTLPRAVSQDVKDIKQVTEGIQRGDPFVTFTPSRTGVEGSPIAKH